MTDLFLPAATIVVGIEDEKGTGAVSTQAGDAGGATAWGIARAFHLEETPWPPSRDRALAIYRSEYWDPVRAGDLPWPWALALFDGFVNQRGSVVKNLQIALGVPVDGTIGDRTVAAVQRASGELFPLFLANRAISYSRAPLFGTDGHGWFKRLFIIAYAAALPPAAPPAS